MFLSLVFDVMGNGNNILGVAILQSSYTEEITKNQILAFNIVYVTVIVECSCKSLPVLWEADIV